MGLFWRRATSVAAWASTIASFGMLLFTSKISMFGKTLWDFNAVFADRLPEFMRWEGKLYLPWQMIIYLVVGLIAAIVVSVFTKPEKKEKLDKFYQCIRTPVRAGESETEAFTLPEGVEPAPRNVWLDHPDFEIPKPTLVGVVGFLAGWAAVGALIAMLVLILRQ